MNHQLYDNITGGVNPKPESNIFEVGNANDFWYLPFAINHKLNDNISVVNPKPEIQYFFKVGNANDFWYLPFVEH
jgi:hypothetical protein